MIIWIGTTYAPDNFGLDNYNAKVTLFINSLVNIIPESRTYHPQLYLNDESLHDQVLIVHPEYLQATANITKTKTLLLLLMTQARKRNITIILISPITSAKNYTDQRMHNFTDIYINGEYLVLELISLFNREHNPCL